MAMRACSTFHADTACPPCKIKCVHGALCCDQNSQPVYDIFFLPFRSRTKLAATISFISRLILAHVATLKRDKNLKHGRYYNFWLQIARNKKLYNSSWWLIISFCLLAANPFIIFLLSFDSYGHTRAPCALLQYPLKSSHVPNQGTGKCSVIRNFDKFRSNRLISTDRNPGQKFRLYGTFKAMIVSLAYLVYWLYPPSRPPSNVVYLLLTSLKHKQ